MSTDSNAVAQDFAAIFNTKTRDVLKAALGRSCQSEVSPSSDPWTYFPEDGLLRLRITFSGGLEGSLSIILTQPEGAFLADLLMMGDGSASWNEEQLDALKEIGNQLGGAVVSNLGERWSVHINNAGSSCEHWKKEETPGVVFNFSFQIQGEEDYPAALWLEDDLVQSLLHQSESSAWEQTTSWLEEPSTLDKGQANLDPGPAAPLITSASPASAGEPLPFTPPTPMAPPSATAAPAAAAAGTSAAASASGVQTSGAAGESVGVNWLDSNDPALARLLDVPIDIHIELGKTELAIRRVLEIGPGSIIELDRAAGEPVDLVVNDRVVARGEVVVVDENFGIRITQLVSPEERIRRLR